MSGYGMGEASLKALKAIVSRKMRIGNGER